MARSPRDRFERERDRVADLADAGVRPALLAFADALDTEMGSTLGMCATRVRPIS